MAYGNCKRHSYYVAYPKFQNFSRNPQDISLDCFRNWTIYKFKEKWQLIITEHFKQWCMSLKGYYPLYAINVHNYLTAHIRSVMQIWQI